MRLVAGEEVDRYEVSGLLGVGGMAAVYLVVHRELGTHHALKVLGLDGASLADRLVQEGRLQGRLRHPNVVAVTDAVRIQGAPALVMELVRGPSVAEWLAAQRPTEEQVELVARGVLAGVAAAHDEGLIHRDIKPGNVLLAVEGRGVVPKVADFGLAKHLDPHANVGLRTKAGMAMGTPAYMPPEQIRDASGVDERADVFALGVLLLELAWAASGRRGLGAVVAAAREGRELPELGLKARWGRAIAGALATEVQDRPIDAGALLELWSGDEPAPVDAWPAASLTGIEALAPRTPAVDTLQTLGTAASGADDTFAETLLPGGDEALAALSAPPAEPLSPAPEPSSSRWGLWLGLGLAGVLAVAAVMAMWPADSLGDRIELHGDRLVAAFPAQRGDIHAVVSADGSRAMTVTREGHLTEWRDLIAHPVILEREGDRFVQKNAEGVDLHQVLVESLDSGRVRLHHQTLSGVPVRSPWEETLAGSLQRTPGAFVEEHQLREGMLVGRRWLTPSGEPMIGHDGSWGVSYERDERGRVTARTTLDSDGRPARDIDGIVTVRTQWSDTGVRHQLEAFGGVAVPGPDRWSAFVADGDLQIAFDRDGELVPWYAGCARVRVSAEEDVCVDAEGAPTPAATGWVRKRRSYDERGNLVRRESLDGDGQLVADKRGTAVKQYTVDPLGRVTQLGPDLGVDGVAQMPGGRRWASMRIDYDAMGQAFSHASFDASGEPSALTGGATVFTRRLDVYGNELETRTYGFDGLPVTDDDGVARIVRTHDASGALLSIAYFDEVGKPVAGDGEIAEMRFERDQLGRELSRERYGVDGPFQGQGWFRLETKLHRSGESVEEACFSADRMPTLCDSGVAVLRFELDEAGRELARAAFDPQGNPFENALGVHRMQRSYLPDRVRNEQFDARGEPTAICPVFVEFMNERGKALGYRCETVGGEVAPDEEGSYGRIGELDARDRAKSVSFFDSQGGIARTRHFVYDARGNLVSTEARDPGGALMLDPELGYARLEVRFDERNLWAEGTTYGPDGAPMEQGGYARMVATYNTRGQDIEWRHFDALGEPTRAFPPIKRFVYGADGALESEQALNLDGSPWEEAQVAP